MRKCALFLFQPIYGTRPDGTGGTSFTLAQFQEESELCGNF